MTPLKAQSSCPSGQDTAISRHFWEVPHGSHGRARLSLSVILGKRTKEFMEFIRIYEYLRVIYIIMIKILLFKTVFSFGEIYLRKGKMQ